MSSFRVLAPKPPVTGESLRQELIRIASISLTVLNNRDFDHASPLGREVAERIASDFQARVDNVPGLMSFREMNEVWRGWKIENPRLEYAEVEITSDIDEEKGEAITYMDMDMNGMGDVDLKAFSAHKWRRGTDGRWVIYDFTAMRGMHGNEGFIKQS